jgi:4'-phosphopantetheinyl transferase
MDDVERKLRDAGLEKVNISGVSQVNYIGLHKDGNRAGYLFNTMGYFAYPPPEPPSVVMPQRKFEPIQLIGMSLANLKLPRFDDNQVHLWLTDWTKVQLPPRTVLSVDEQDRLKETNAVGKANEFQHTRTFLRNLLSAYTGVPAGDLKIAENDDGKPHLTDPAQPLKFNLSHSGNMALIGTLSDWHLPGVQIGVDVATVDPEVNWRARAPFELAPVEIGYLKSLPANRAAREYYRIWAIKEAVFKANGKNAVMKPSAVSVVDEKGEIALGGAWDVHHYQVQVTEQDGHWVAVALSADRSFPPPRILLTRLAPGDR